MKKKEKKKHAHALRHAPRKQSVWHREVNPFIAWGLIGVMTLFCLFILNPAVFVGI
ncbi:hypothetical protein M1555_03840 [Patescibacteria group bacterium]|nr:hypothetical protein [Patescibacteria group bacterium]